MKEMFYCQRLLPCLIGHCRILVSLWLTVLCVAQHITRIMDALKDNALFFKEVPPPHRAINCFEDELGLLWHYNIFGSKWQCCQHEKCIYYGTRPRTESRHYQMWVMIWWKWGRWSIYCTITLVDSEVQGRSWVFIDGGAYYKLLTIT